MYAHTLQNKQPEKPTSTAASSSSSADLEKTLDPIFQAQVDNGKIPGAAAIALDASGKVLFSKGYGHQTAGDSSSAKVTPQSSAMIWSCTKLVTCVAALQLVEQGKLNLDDPAEKYVPDIGKVQRLHGFNADKSPKLAPPENPIKVIHLFTHTAGFVYDFFNQDYMNYRIAKDLPPVAYVTHSSINEYNGPLAFEPGSRWEYGSNIEWLGFIVEKISGLSLAEYVDKHIAQPLGLKATGQKLTPEQDKGFVTVHAKDPHGNLQPTPTRMPESPEVVPGGHYLYSTAEDYADFLLTILNNGTHPKTNVKILNSDTVKNYIFKDMLPGLGVSGEGISTVPSTVPQAVLTGSFMPGISTGWSLGGLINNESLPNGRNKGSMAWAGLGNLYYWMDPTAGKLGLVVTGILPFFDQDVLHLADALERAVYGKPAAKEMGEQGSNFSGGIPA